MTPKDKALLEGAFARMIERSGIKAGDEPHLMFGMLWLQLEVLEAENAGLRKQFERLTKPKLLPPSALPSVLKESKNG